MFERTNQKSNDIIECILLLFSTQIFLIAVALLLGFGICNSRSYLSGKTLNVFLKVYLRSFPSIALRIPTAHNFTRD